MIGWAAVVQLLSVVGFSFGAVSFIILAGLYWNNRARRTSPLGLFSIACSGAFLANLASTLVLTDSRGIALLHSVCAGLLPPLMLDVVIHLRVKIVHFVYRRHWRVALWLSYAVAVVVALLRGFAPSDEIDIASRLVFAIIIALSFAQLWCTATISIAATQERRWLLAIFGALLCCAVIELAADEISVLSIAPDYLILAFFAVHLYYSERLLFFDVFLKGGAFFATGLIVLALTMTITATASTTFGSWDRLWIGVLLLMPTWLLAPATNRMLAQFIDRHILMRRYSSATTDSLFLQVVQTADTEHELLKQAEEALRRIFKCSVLIDLQDASYPSDPGYVVIPIVPKGTVRLDARDRSSPFLSEELGLLHALTVMLGTSLHSLQLRRMREEQRIREQELRALATRAELRALRAQINPHFLFNALNAVAGCIRTRPDVADETLAELAQVFRYTLTRSENEWVRLKDELDFVQSYLAVEQTRFGDRLRVTINADRWVTSVIVPAMILQPVVENAIKHGTSRLRSTGKVGITVGLSENGLLTIAVSDNGPGFSSTGTSGQFAASGHGLRNVAERLWRYYGATGRLQWQNGAESTIVTIEIPTEAPGDARTDR